MGIRAAGRALAIARTSDMHIERVRSARQDTPLGRANLPPPIGSQKAEAEKELTHTYSAEAFGDLLLSLSHLIPFPLSSTAYECCLDTR